MSGAADRELSAADRGARCVAGRRLACSRARRVGLARTRAADGGPATGEVGVQHRPDRLPGGDHRPVLRRPDHLPSPTRTSATTASPPTTTRAGRPFCRGVIVRELAAPAEQLAVGRGAWRTSSSDQRLPGHRRGRHPPADPPPPRRRGHARRLRPGQRPGRSTRPLWPRRRAEPGTDGVDLVAEVTTAEPPTGRRRARSGWWPTTSASSGPSCATWAALATVDGGAGVDPGRGGARPPARRGVPVQRPGRPGRRRRYAADAIARPARARCRCSASASATSCWPRPSGPRPTSCRSATTAATTRCGGWRPARSRSPARTTTTPSPPGTVAGRRRHPRQPQRRRHRGLRLPRRARPSACSTTPRPGPGPTTPATCSSEFRRL